MTIFEFINILFFRSKVSYEDPNYDSLTSFVPFMLNRWLSFYGKNQSIFVNETLNKYTGIFTDKLDSYKFYYNLIPRQKFSRIQYIKKQKSEPSDTNNELINRAASGANISQRELTQYLDFYKQYCK